MRRIELIGVIFALLILAACSKKHEGLPTGFKYDPLPAPENLVVTGGSEIANISWSFPAEKMSRVKEFRVYQYIESYNMLQLIGTTTDTTFTDSLLIGNLLYCYKVSAVDTTDFEGWRTNETCAFVLGSHSVK